MYWNQGKLAPTTNESVFARIYAIRHIEMALSASPTIEMRKKFDELVDETEQLMIEQNRCTEHVQRIRERNHDNIACCPRARLLATITSPSH